MNLSLTGLCDKLTEAVMHKVFLFWGLERIIVRYQLIVGEHLIVLVPDKVVVDIFNREHRSHSLLP